MKFNIGDKVYTTQEFPVVIKQTCTTCNGTGKSPIPDNKVSGCRKCNTKGFLQLRRGKEWVVAGPYTIEAIKNYREDFKNKNMIVTTYNDYTKTISNTYYMLAEYGFPEDSWEYGLTENELYLYKEDAQKECERRNK